MIKKILLFLAVFSLSAASAENNITATEQVKQIIEDEGLVGISWSTVVRGEVKLGSAGYANIENTVPMKPTHKMHVGSVSKSVMALGVLRLISEGELSLETNVESLLTQLEFDNPWHQHSPIKVKNLLDHTAGLDNIRMWQLLSTKPSPDTPLEEAFQSSYHNLLTVRKEPGTQYSYSNMGYTLLAMVIEAVTNQRYEEYLDNNLLTPLGMKDSSFEFVSQSSEPLLAMGYHDNHVAQEAVSVYLRPSGQFTTTPADMAKFIQFVLDDGQLNGQRFIDSSLMEKLSYPNNTDAHKAGLAIGHGLAFAARDRHGVVGECHPGTTFGFRANICIYPDEEKGYFYATNTDSETADYEKLKELFANVLEVNSAPIIDSANEDYDTSGLQGIYLLSPNSMAEFEFIDMVFGYVWLTPSNEHLVIKSLQSADKQLVQIDKNMFRDIERAQPSHVFYKNKEGERLLSDGLKTYKKGALTQVAFYWLSFALGLIGFVYILLIGLVRLVRRDSVGFGRLKWGFINLMSFAVPTFFYMNQSFLAFGDITTASVSLAILTGLLPITLLLSLWVCLKSREYQKSIKLDAIFILMSLQMCLVLAAWGLIPTIFWQ